MHNTTELIYKNRKKIKDLEQKVTELQQIITYVTM